MTCIKKVKDFRHERLLFGGTLGNQKAASGERQQTRHSSRPPAVSASDSQCQLPGSRFELLEFRFVVDSRRKNLYRTADLQSIGDAVVTTGTEVTHLATVEKGADP